LALEALEVLELLTPVVQMVLTQLLVLCLLLKVEVEAEIAMP
jgi:hypothetical protein